MLFNYFTQLKPHYFNEIANDTEINIKIQFEYVLYMYHVFVSFHIVMYNKTNQCILSEDFGDDV